ncbi:MAG: type I-E CRISPR-associated endoribonuclease Cas2 [Nannocystis sp.]|nr:type I-E CRISPR-associated endoribonuclease Cas2 [Nannocystis sp.]
MPMTVVVTSALPDRFRGFLASCMCEIAPGVFTSPNMNDGVRKRVWDVLCDWFAHFPAGGSIVMTWPSKQEPGGQGLLTLGLPKRELVAHDGMVFVRWPPSPNQPPAEPSSGPPATPRAS